MMDPIEADFIGEPIHNNLHNIVIKKGNKFVETYIDLKSGDPILPLSFDILNIIKKDIL